MEEVPINEIAECVGLWLAEGDKTTIREVTLTNNSVDIILFFSQRIMSLYKGKNKPRIYAYSPYKKKPYSSFNEIKINFYNDFRANKPYYIFRLADTNFVKYWKAKVEEIKNNKNLYPDILRGFFAGEGNIKEASRNRVIRIAQKQQLEIIDSILNHYKINFTFSKRERSYVITSRINWDRLAELKIADLHPEKKEKFYNIYKKFKEYHYPHNHIKDKILGSLYKPKTSRELASEFGRTQARLQRILSNLKEEGKVRNFRVRSKNYWVNSDSKLILISERKKSILNLLKNPLRTVDIANNLNIDEKSIARRLAELQKLGLVERNEYLWSRTDIDKEVKVL
ncbi:MAG: hypothetical protein WA139_06110 [Candidatus Aenigmatarchaeota archaeon]